jgi:hypothetical protein
MRSLAQQRVAQTRELIAAAHGAGVELALVELARATQMPDTDWLTLLESRLAGARAPARDAGCNQNAEAPTVQVESLLLMLPNGSRTAPAAGAEVTPAPSPAVAAPKQPAPPSAST